MLLKKKVLQIVFFSVSITPLSLHLFHISKRIFITRNFAFIPKLSLHFSLKVTIFFTIVCVSITWMWISLGINDVERRDLITSPEPFCFVFHAFFYYPSFYCFVFHARLSSIPTKKARTISWHMVMIIRDVK